MTTEQSDGACAPSFSSAELGGARETRGYWFSFKRGTWSKVADGAARHIEHGGLTYIGSLTKEQQSELDVLISEYVDRIKSTPNAGNERTPLAGGPLD